MESTEIRAKGRFLRFSPFKGRVVAAQVKGKPVYEALQLLKFSPKKGSAPAIYKVMASALANAQQREGVDVDGLFVKNVIVDEGPTLKRIRFRARGRVDRVFKRMSHVTVILDQA
ncbi:MAG: 50S ribosomal protein L22 [Candidatus Lernaella stagnicola]|nr:50S ribosomal protein L22 [Candidatus Lernaella stagnicola]